MIFKLTYSPQALRGIKELPTEQLKNLAEKVLLYISENPYLGKKLSGKLKGLYSSRVTRNYRIIYFIQHTSHTVFVVDVSHRKEVYR